jgi:drug/metabolite transporter (DMT)-like permease
LTATAWLVMAYLTVICTLIGYSLWYLVIRDTDVSLAAMTILLQPAVGVFIAALTVGESLHWGQLWGAAAIVIGLVIGLGVGLNAQPRAPTSEECAPPAPL